MKFGTRDDKKYVLAAVVFGETERLFSDAEHASALFDHFSRVMHSQRAQVKTELVDLDAQTEVFRTTSSRSWSKNNFVKPLTSCESDESRLFAYVDVRQLGQPPSDPRKVNQPLALCQLFDERDCPFAKYIAIFAQELLPSGDSLFLKEVAAFSSRFSSVYTYRNYWYQRAGTTAFLRCIEDFRSEEVYRAMYGQELPTLELINQASKQDDEGSRIETDPWHLLT